MIYLRTLCFPILLYRKISTGGNTKNRKICMGDETMWLNLTSVEVG